MTSGLIVAMRGYDMTQVDQLLARADLASASTDPQLRRAVCQELQATRLRHRLRGYSRPQVDLRVQQLITELATRVG